MKFNILDWICLILVIIGGLNWGLVGAFHFNLVETFFGEMTLITNIIYIIVGVSALYMIYLLHKLTKK